MGAALPTVLRRLGYLFSQGTLNGLHEALFSLPSGKMVITSVITDTHHCTRPTAEYPFSLMD